MTTKQAPPSSGNTPSVQARVGSVLVFAGLWWVLTGGDARSWLIGAPAVLLASWTALRCAAPNRWRWRLMGVIRFVPFFLWESLQAGIEVARYALMPRLSVNPGLVEYQLRITHDPARTFLLNTINLLPGTLSVELKVDDRLLLHVVNSNADIAHEMHKLEVRIADLFDLSPSWALEESPYG